MRILLIPLVMLTVAWASLAAAEAEAVVQDPGIVMPEGGGDPGGPTLGKAELLVINVAFPDDLTEQDTEESLNRMMKGVSDWYTEASYNNMQISWTVTPKLVMPHSWRFYDEIVPMNDPNVPNVFVLAADAQRMARKAGYDPSNYDLFTFRHRGGIFGGWTGLGGGGMTWLKASSVCVQIHEVGHAIGLPHANAWLTNLGGEPMGVIGAGDAADGYGYLEESLQYGDVHDVMGSGCPGHFNPIYKHQLGWLTDDWIIDVTESGTYRVHAFDADRLEAGNSYALRLPKNHRQTYWMSYRNAQRQSKVNAVGGINFTKWAPTSLQFHMDRFDSMRERDPCPNPQTSFMLDMTPDSQDDRADAGLNLGRTYSDWESHLHVTTIGVLPGYPGALDVVVNIGPFPDNRAPKLGVTASKSLTSTDQLMVEVGEPLRFDALASDDDGDALAYYWDFGDNTNSSDNVASITYSWQDPGLYTLRCIVSDMKGGTATRHYSVNVGMAEFPGLDQSDPLGRQQFYAHGRIVDQLDQAIEGVRVYIVRSNPVIETRTDSDGRFTIAGVQAANADSVVFRAHKDGWSFAGVDTASPLPIGVPFNFNDIENLNFVGYQRQHVTVSLLDPNNDEDGDGILDLDDPDAVGSRTLVVPEGDAGTRTYYYRVRRTFPQVHVKEDDRDYEIIDELPNSQLWVRFYAGGQATIEVPYPFTGNPDQIAIFNAASPNKATWTYQPPKLMNETPVRNPEYKTQLRSRETAIDCTRGAYTNIQGDHYLFMPFNVDYVDVRVTFSGNTIPQADREHAFMVAFSPDYWSPQDEARLVIEDDDPTPTVEVSVRSSSFSPGRYDIPGEEPGGGGSIIVGTGMENGQSNSSFIISRNGKTDGALTVRFEIDPDAFPNAATRGVDYDLFYDGALLPPPSPAGSPEAITIPRGVSEARIVVVAKPDGIVEGPETVTFNLLTNTGYTVTASDSATNIIVDMAQTQVYVVNTRGPAEEATNGTGNPSSGRFNIRRIGPLDQGVSVNISWPTAGTRGAAPLRAANLGEDFTTEAGPSVYIAPGLQSVDVTFEPIPDGLLEGDEIVTLRIEPGSGYTIANPSFANAVIKDAELPYVGVTVSGGSTRTEGQTGAFTFTRTGNPENQLNVHYSLSGTADHGFDYVVQSASQGVVNFPANVRSVTVPVRIQDDDVQEGDESFFLNLLPGDPSLSFAQTPSYNVILSQRTASMTIRDNDAGDGVLPVVKFPVRQSHVYESLTLRNYYRDIASRGSSVSDVADPYAGPFLNPNLGVWVELSVFPNHEWLRSGDPTQAHLGFAMVDYEIVENNLPGAIKATAATLLASNPQTGTNYGAADVTSQPNWDFIPHDSTWVGFTWPRDYMPAVTWDEQLYRDRLTGLPIVFNEAGVRADGPANFSFVTINNPPDDIRTGRDTAALAGGTIYFDVYKPTNILREREYFIPLPPINDDDLREPDETFIIRLKNARNCKIPEAIEGFAGVPDVHVVTILDDDWCDVSITATKPVATEGGEPGEFRLQRTGDSDFQLRVVLEFAGTASAPFDFGYLVGGEILRWGEDSMLVSYTFAVNETSKLIPIVAFDDNVPEPEEFVDVRIVAAPHSDFDPSAYARVTIIDNDVAGVHNLVNVGFAAVGDNLAYEEGLVPAKLEFSRTITTSTQTIRYDIGANSTAIAGEDYLALSGEVEFPSGVEKVTVLLRPLQDELIEGPETVIVALRTDPSYRIGSSPSAIVHIVDNDDPTPEVTIRAIRPRTVEGDSAGFGRFAIYRSQQAVGALTVTYQLLGDAINGTDYTTISADTVSFAANEFVKFIDIYALDDANAEGEELVTIRLVATGSLYTVGTPSSATVTIIDADRATVRIRADRATTTEGAGDRASFIISRTGGDTGSSLSVSLVAGVGGSASASDYDFGGAASGDLPATATIPAGATEATIWVDALDDALPEVDEILVVRIAAGGYTTVSGEDEAYITIRDNDLDRVSVTAHVKEASEDPLVNGVFRISRGANTNGALNVRYRITGSALAGADYVDNLLTTGLNYGTATIPNGASHVDVTVEVIDDGLVEIPETVIMTVVTDGTGNYNLASGSSATATVFIASDDVTRVTVVAQGDYVKHGLLPATGFLVQRAGSSRGPLRINYVMSGSAINGTDYVLLPTFVDLRDREVEKLVPIVPLVDPTVRKTITMTIADPARIGSYEPSSPVSDTMQLLASHESAVQIVTTQGRAVERTHQRARMLINRAGDVGLPITVRFNLSNGGSPGLATQRLDYPLTQVMENQQLGFNSFETEYLMEFYPFDDRIPEGPELLSVLLTPSGTNPPEYFIVGSGIGIATIVDDAEREITMEVYDGLGIRRRADSYVPIIDPDDGNKSASRDIYHFEGLTASTDYTLLFQTFIVKLYAQQQEVAR